MRQAQLYLAKILMTRGRKWLIMSKSSGRSGVSRFTNASKVLMSHANAPFGRAGAGPIFASSLCDHEATVREFGLGGTDDLVLAVNEAVTNVLDHAGGRLCDQVVISRNHGSSQVRLRMKHPPANNQTCRRHRDRGRCPRVPPAVIAL